MKRRGPSVTAAVLLLGVTLFLAALLTTCDSGLNAGLEEKEEQDDPNGPTVPGTGISVDRQLAEALEISWDAASDRTTATGELEYLLVYSSSDNIDSVADAESNGSVAIAWSVATLDGEITGLTYGTDYYVNVLVRDGSGRKGSYGTVATATSDDGDAPATGGAISVDTVDMEEISISWPAATDPGGLTAQADLEYKVVYSDGAAIDTATAAQANGTVSLDWTTAATSHTITGLIDDWDYVITVLVRDEVENTEVYTAVEETTVKHGRIFIVDGGADAILVCEYDGSSLTAIVTDSISNPSSIAVDAEARKIYWTDISTDTIKRANFDGSGVETLISSGLNTPRGVAVDASGGYLYWVDNTNEEVYRSSLTPPTQAAGDYILLDSGNGVASPEGIDVDQATGDVYWTECTSPPRIRKVTRYAPTTVVEFIHSGYFPSIDPYLLDPYDLAVDPAGGTIYWIEASTNTRVRSKPLATSSSENELVTSNLTLPRSIDIVRTGSGDLLVFWSDSSKNQLYKATAFSSTDADDYKLVTGTISQIRGISVY